MNRRTGVVGLFVAILLVLGVWFVLPQSQDGPRPSSVKRPLLDKEGKLKTQGLRAMPIQRGPETSMRELAERQQRLMGIASSEGKTRDGRRRGVFPLDERGVASAINSRRLDLEACYETALFHTPGLQGTLTLVLQVEPQEEIGQVSSVAIEGDLDATVFEGCVATVLEELRFEAGEPTTLRYPMTFNP